MAHVLPGGMPEGLSNPPVFESNKEAWGRVSVVTKKVGAAQVEKPYIVVDKVAGRQRVTRAAFDAYANKKQLMENFENVAFMCYFLSEVILYLGLGWAASMVVQYQEKYEDKEYDSCFVTSKNLTYAADAYDNWRLSRPGALADDDCRTRSNFDFSPEENSYFDDDGLICIEAKSCPDFAALPDRNFVYTALTVYVIAKILCAFLDYFATKYENSYLYRIYGVYEVVRWETARCAKVRATDEQNPEHRTKLETMELPELVVKGRDDTWSVLGLIAIFGICVAIMIMTLGKEYIIVGLVLGVTAGITLAFAVNKSIEAHREICYATWDVVSSIAMWSNAAFRYDEQGYVA